MKRFHTYLAMMATLILATDAWADFTFISDDPEICNYLANEWEGKGKASNWLFSCSYTGTGSISQMDETGHFTVALSAKKRSGGVICPDYVNQELRGTCQAGVVTFITDYGNLKGNFSQESGNAKGTLTYSPGASATVSVTFQRRAG